ncbi:hypothetical protein FQN52_001129 [Onygenales sp. PD_12]|nr:hypothetical protein FQN52_001129 [Onygenales sp. PD_12]
MDNPPMSSPPSILVCDFNSSQDRRRPSSSKSSSARNFSARPFRTPQGPMAIPNANEPLAPPPLPPPRYIEDLANGHDSGWKWGNSFEDGEFGKTKLAPIKPSSSLLGGGHTRPELVRRMERVGFEVNSPRRSAMSVPEVSPDLKSQQGFPSSRETSLPSLLTSSLPGPQLHGEKPLSEKSVERSSNAYDQHLLSKIGKPSSPPRQSASLGSFSHKEFATLPFHSKSRNGLSSLSIADGSLSPRDAASRWNNTPQSAGISPGTRPGWTDYVSYRSPSVDSAGPHQLEFDHFRDRNHSTGTYTNDDAASVRSRSNRGSYDQAVYNDTDADFPMDESAQSRQLSIDDRASQIESLSPLSKQGMKRRASSPPRDAVSDELRALHTSTSNGDLDQRRTIGFPFNGCTSPGARYQPSHGSISSVSSASLRNGSYASSTGLSVAASSMTSMSSYDRPSPGGISPTSELESSYEKGFISPTSHKPLSSLSSRTPHHREPIEVKSAPPSRNVSIQGPLSLSKPAAPRISRLHICECCQKKPKKFETEEELRAHELEKQYTCSFCNKRFKNKNEAERHQNSLHLRRHSWSCAALSGYEAAFHPSASPTCQTPTGPSHDTCGYCGDEFPNFPQPEWDRRIDHLTNVHKFGECNQAKKFYRADHFRQHLKHSHAGASGKWTNILENACMKEEPSVEGGLASIGEQSGRASENGTGDDIGNGSTCGVRISHTIDEAMEEP